MFGSSHFSHFLSYGATDQQTLRELRGLYDGLVVPGTIAAFQHEGTGGFVLTLSATVEGAPYVIDPRFPLFQQALPSAKRSHRSLATALGMDSLIRNEDPMPNDFTSDVIAEIAENWVAFNESYRGGAGGKFDKYQARLDEPVLQRNAQPPNAILAPYFVADGPGDAWWHKSEELFEATTAAAVDVGVLRVVAASSTKALASLLPTIGDHRLIIWVSGLHELQTSSQDLAMYLTSIRDATEAGASSFALYGGFFSVLCSTAGLSGASHGVGYGEHRSWIELPQSGPPPARYYLPITHRYVSQDDAQRLWNIDKSLIGCACSQCDAASPIELDYHGLMKHSVECRTTEIANWAGLDAHQAAARLDTQRKMLLDTVNAHPISPRFWRRVEGYVDHIPRWTDALNRFTQT